jgi:hypothetical protein
MKSTNKDIYQENLEDMQDWHNEQFKMLKGFDMEAASQKLISASLFTLTQFLITKELYQLRNDDGK